MKENGHKLVHSNDVMIRQDSLKSDRIMSHPISLMTSAEKYTRITLQTLAPIEVMSVNSEDYSSENDSGKAMGMIMTTVRIMSIEMIL